MLNLVQLQERLKDLPMQAIMQYANGANPQVPPFLALGELNRRKKMQESAAAEQSKEMAGAPTVKEQIEQASGLMALQGARQRQAASQQAGITANMAMPAPNTMTSEPAQMASGGAVNEVMPRDYQAGGRVDPAMIKTLMALAAMKQRRPGIAGLPINTFNRKDYAGGGIVAFKNGGAADVINAALEEEQQADETANMTPEEKRMLDLLARIKAVKSLAERKKEAGIGEAPDTQAERLRALEDQQRRFGESDTVTRRMLALNPRQLGRSMDEYLTRRETGQKDIENRMAEIKDLRAKAKYDAAMGDIKAARDDEMAILDKERGIYKDIADIGVKTAQRDQAFAGKTTDWMRRYRAYLPRIMQQMGIEDPNDPRVTAATAEKVDEMTALAGRRVDIAGQQAATAAGREATQDYEAAAKIIDPMIQRGGSKYQEYRKIEKEEGKEKAAEFRRGLIQEEIDRMRGKRSNAPSPAPSASTSAAKGPVTVTVPGGKTFTFPNQQAANEFKKRAGIQ